MAMEPPFSELIAATTTSAVHLETRDAYTPDDPAFLDWKAGGPVAAPAGAAWYDLVREHTARGVSFRRARIISEPLADYARFEFQSTEFNICAGELVRFGFFAGDGAFLRHELADDPEVARACAEAFERVWELATPHSDYRPES